AGRAARGARGVRPPVLQRAQGARPTGRECQGGRDPRAPHRPDPRRAVSASDATTQVVVTDVPDASRYEARVGDELLGIAEYRLTPDVITFLHTEVLPAAEGR